ncbi:MAG TPA: hypothetical protein VIQ27_19300 [Gemmatimonadales bacterium]
MRALAGLACVAAALVGLIPSRADGQVSVVPDAHQPEEDAWRFSVAPYGWLAAEQGRVGVGGTESEVDLDFGDVLDQTDLTLRGIFEARHRRWIGLLDFMYSSLSADQEYATETVRALLDQVTLQPEVGYTLLQRSWGGIDGVVGARLWYFNLDLLVLEGSSESQIGSGDQQWLDGTVGGRLRYSPAPRWHLFLKSDVGAGGSDFTWQALAGGGVDLGDCCAAVASYRHLDVNYQSDEFLNDVYLTGPALGLEIRF